MIFMQVLTTGDLKKALAGLPDDLHLVVKVDPTTVFGTFPVRQVLAMTYWRGDQGDDRWYVNPESTPQGSRDTVQVLRFEH